VNQNQPLPSPRRGPGLFWPVILIGLGVIFLLSNMGLLSADVWSLLWQLWPVILIVIGLDVLLGRRSVWGGVLSAVLALLVVGGIVALLFFAQTFPTLYNWDTHYSFGAHNLHSQHIAYPLGDVQQADVQIDFPGGQGSISALEDSANLAEGDLTSYGDLNDSFSVSGSIAQLMLGSHFSGWNWGWDWSDGRQSRWQISLNPRAGYDLRLDSGSGSYEIDLRKLTLRSLTLDSGSGHVALSLPELGQYRFQVNSGSGTVDIRVPQGMAMCVEYDAGSGELNAPALHRISGGKHNGVYETDGFSQAGSYILMELHSGSGSVTIR
jgi:LiaI-LiaF-like transmembrane region